MQDVEIMRIALQQARMAAVEGEVPVGAVVSKDGEIISMAHNRRELDKNALAHAEVLAINEACRILGGWRLWECDLFVTLEPCPMCAGAIINSRIKRVIYGAKDLKAGCCGSIVDLFSYPFNHAPVVQSGMMEKECREELQQFFANLRKRKKDKANLVSENE